MLKLMQQRKRGGTGIFEKAPFIFLEFGLPKVDATAQQAVSEGASENLRRVGSCCNSGTDDFEKPPILFWRRVFQKWMQLCNRHFRRDLLIFKEWLEADATAEQMFLKRPPQFFLKSSLLKVDATAQQAFSKGPFEYPRRSCGC